ncbi:uroporphyrinogen decarboxylase family protein [candidate division KSB1 bacterium]
MTSRERVLTALAHREPDRIPVDFGSATANCMQAQCIADLRDYYGLERRPVLLYDSFQMLGWIEEDLKKVLRLDVEGMMPPRNIVGIPNTDWRPWRLFNGLEVLVPGGYAPLEDDNGDLLLHPQGDPSAPASARMPKDGFYFDPIERNSVPAEDARDPSENLEEFKTVSDQDLNWLKLEAERAAGTGRAVMAKTGAAGTSFGDILLIPGLALKNPKGIRSTAEWMIAHLTRPDYIRSLFERQSDLAVANLERIAEVIGNLVDVVWLCSTDFGTQSSTFFSVDTYRQLYLPFYKRLTDWIHIHTQWRVLKHSCGAVAGLMESFIDSGFDIITPVQCSAAGMKPAQLKAAYGDRIVFWGGGVDTQKTLPFGSPADVREEVLGRCEIFSKDGGFVFNAVHNIQAGTPVENIVAMFDAVWEFNGGS